jgi:hypothetical protein
LFFAFLKAKTNKNKKKTKANKAKAFLLQSGTFFSSLFFLWKKIFLFNVIQCFEKKRKSFFFAKQNELEERKKKY